MAKNKMFVGVDDNLEVPYIYFEDEQENLLGAYVGTEDYLPSPELEAIVYGGMLAELAHNVTDFPDEERERILENYGMGEGAIGTFPTAADVFLGTALQGRYLTEVAEG